MELKLTGFVEPTHDEIAALAYTLFLENGRDDLTNWLQAEVSLLHDRLSEPYELVPESK